ncbi:MAG: biotin--[acetyl-CoA-carboxylase] ligase [Hydrogenoanaerobacterium sp.]
MNKLDILAQLESCNGTLSGEALAKKLGVTRAAVWKGIKSLQKDGYSIGSAAGSGYFLEEKTDALLESKIRDKLNCKRIGGTITILQSTASTNDSLRTAAYDGAPEGTVLLAEEQTAGKGRLGRSFYSPQRNGIYMSVILRPQLPFQKVHMLTMLAAVCVTEAINTVTGLSPQIKWVNDILLNGQKLCGILSEAAVTAESGELNFVVVGIGINVGSTINFPSLQGNTAGALREHTNKQFSRCDIIAEILNNLEKYYFPYIISQNNDDFLQHYQKALCVLGKTLTVVQGQKTYTATATELLNDGSLLVRCEDGSTQVLSSGEVSLRL